MNQLELTTTGSCEDQQLIELVDEITACLQADQQLDIDHYLTRYPEYADRLTSWLHTMTAMADLGNSLALYKDADATAATTTDVEDQVTGQLGDYRVLGELGRGGMGVVYEAEQISIGRRVALKVLPFAAMLDKQQLNRFKNEARAAGTLDHPNIVSVFSVGTERGVHYYAMQLIEGQSLAELIADLQKSKGEASGDKGTGDGQTITNAGRKIHPPQLTPMQTPQETPVTETKRDLQAAISTIPEFDTQDYFHRVAELGIQAAEAIDHAHQSGIVHRDIKPGNLLVDAQGKLWVADFGLARIETDAGMTMTGDLLGTLRYMSPEQAGGDRAVVSNRTDIYSLGATLYELLTLQPAFTSTDRQPLLQEVISTVPMPLRKRIPQIPADLETIIHKAMEKDPADRYATAAEMAADLRAFAEHRPITARPPSLIARTKRFTRQHFVLVALTFLFLTLVTILLGAGLAIINREHSKTVVALDDAHDSLQFARLTVDQMYTQLASQWLVDDQAITPTQRNFLEKALRIYQRLANGAREDPQSQWEAGTSYGRVARIQHRLGHYRQATSAYQRQIATHQRLVDEALDTPDHRAELATAYHDFGLLHTVLEKLPEAMVAWNKAEVLLTPLTKDFPNEPAYLQAAAINNLDRASQLLRAGKDSEAEQLARTAVAIFTQLQQEDKGSLEHQLGLYRSQAFLARVLRFQAELDEAEKLARSAVRFCAARADESPDSRQVRKVQVAALIELADVLVAAERLDEGAALLRTATQVAQHSLRGKISPTAQMIKGIQPEAEWAAYSEPEPLCEYVEIQIRLGVVLGRCGLFYEARQTLADSIRTASVLAATYGWPRFFANEAIARACLAKLLRDTAHSEADAAAATAAYAWHSLLQHYPSGATAMSGIVTGSDLEAFLENFPEQRSAVNGQSPLAAAQGNEKLKSLSITLGVSWYRQASYDSAVQFLKKFTNEASGGDSYAWFYLAMAYHQIGERKQAHKFYQQAVDWMHKHQPENTELQKLSEEAARLLELSEEEIQARASAKGASSIGEEFTINLPQSITG